MGEYFSPTSYLLTNFLKEGAGISREMRTSASGLSIELSRYMLGSPTISPTYEDRARIKRVPHIVHFASQNEYDGMVQKYMEEAQKKAQPIDPLLEKALTRGSLYNKPESAVESTGYTIFPNGSDRATAVILRKPDEDAISPELFLNILSEEMIHAAAPQATFLKEVQRMSPNFSMTPLDFFELVGRWVKFDFLSQYKENPSLILPEERELLSAKDELVRLGVNMEAFKNLYLRGVYRAS